MMSNRKHILTEKEFSVWCKNMVASFKRYEKYHPNIGLLMWGNPSESSRKTVIINMKTMKTSCAKCHPSDEFSRDVGIAIAWARYNNLPVPKVGSKIIDRHDLNENKLYFFLIQL